MSTVETKKIEPASGTTLTLGASGDVVTAPAGVTVKTNTVKDAGGNTLWTSNGSGTLSSVNSSLPGGMVLISSATASNSASVEFTSGIDSTYDEYQFWFVDINPGTDGGGWEWQVNAVGQSGFNEVATTTVFSGQHNEGDTYANIVYHSGNDQANATTYMDLSGGGTGSGSDECVVGKLCLFSPSSTSKVKHFTAIIPSLHPSDYSLNSYVAGYINTTAAIDEVSFKMHSGNFDGNIYMFGVK